MSYAVSDLKSELTGVLHGTTLNQVVGIEVLLNRAARKFLSDLDPMETIRIVELSSPLFDRVYDYPLPDDVKGDRIIDIRPQVRRTVRDRFTQTYNEPFDVDKTRNFARPEFTIQWNTAVKSVRIAKGLIAGLLVNSASSITDNGTWSTAGTASNLREDNVNYVTDTGSLRFDVDAGADPSTASLVNSTMTPVDLTRDEDQGSEFLYVFIPDPSIVTSFTLNWGSSSTDYWTRTVTTTQFNTTFQTGWNLLQFQWNGATQVGSPDASVVNYVKFDVTYDGTADTDFRLNNIVSQLGTLYEIEYYTKFLFRDSVTGAFQETVTDDSNIINLDVDSYNVFFNLVSLLVAQQVQGTDSRFDLSFFQSEYDQSMQRYVAKIKSQVKQPTQRYYETPNITRGKLTRYSSS